MKAIIQKLCMVMAMLWLSISAYAYDFEVDGIYYTLLSLSEGTCSVSSGDILYENEVVIPENVSYKNKSLRVVAIDSDAFRGCINLSQIQMKDNIIKIGKSAFYGCSALQSIQFSNSIEIIEDWTLAYCSSLTAISLPDNTSILGSNIFNGCSAIENIQLPDALTKIGSQDLSSCSKLSELIFPSYLQQIGAIKLAKDVSIEMNFLGKDNSPDLYFNPENGVVIEDESVQSWGYPHNRLHYAIISGNVNSTIRLNRNIVIPEDSGNGNFTAYRYYAFENAPINLTVGEFVTSYDDEKFYYNKDNINDFTIQNSLLPLYLNITKSVNSILLDRDFSGKVLCSNVIIGDHVTSLPNMGFSKSTIKTISIPNSVESIGAYCFYDCRHLECIEIPESIKILNEYVLGNCESLKEITIGPSVEIIDEKSFANVNPILVICQGEIPPQSTDNLFSKNTYLSANLVVPKNSMASYMESSPWGSFFDIKYLSPVTEIVLTDRPPVLEVGSEFIFNAECRTTDEFGYPDMNFKLLWSTSNSEVATVADGKVNAIGPGACEVNVRSSDDYSLCASCPIRVVPVIPDEFESDGVRYRKIDVNHVKVVPNNYAGEIIIPSQVNVNSISLIVSELDNFAFRNCKDLISIKIPGTILELTNDQFAGCVTLKNVELIYGDEVLKIGYNSYLNLSSSITPFPNPSDVDERRTGFKNGYYDGLFYGLPIEHLVIDRDIELPKYYERTMGNSTSSYSTVYNDIVYYPPFYGLTNLKYVEIGENVSAICKNQIEAVINAVPTTMEYANFGKCDNIEVVVSSNSKAPIGGGFSQSVYDHASLFLPNGGIESYKNDDYWKNFAHINETSFIPVESISFESDEVTIAINESKTLNPIINPSEASIRNLKWSSSNASIVNVSEDGIITTSSRDGEAIITATTCDGSGVSASIKVIVQVKAGLSNVLSDDDIDISVEKGTLCIRGKSDTDVVSVYNVQGQLIISTNDNWIDLNSKGIYIVQVNSISKKVII